MTKRRYTKSRLRRVVRSRAADPDAIVQDGIDRHLAGLRTGTGGKKLITALKKYLNYLVANVRSEINKKHSAYRWIHGIRRYFWQELLDTSRLFPDPTEDIEAFLAEFRPLQMRHSRTTIAALKYADTESVDWFKSSETTFR